MDWKKWIATHVRGTPMSLSWLPKCFPVPVANYGVTKWGPDGKPVVAEGSTIATKQMTFANLDVKADEAKVRVSWQYGMTVPNPETPKSVAVDPGGVEFPVADILAIRKMEAQVEGIDPTSNEVVQKPIEVYAFYIREGEAMLVIEIVDVKEDLDGDKVDIEIAQT